MIAATPNERVCLQNFFDTGSGGPAVEYHCSRGFEYSKAFSTLIKHHVTLSYISKRRAQ